MHRNLSVVTLLLGLCLPAAAAAQERTIVAPGTAIDIDTPWSCARVENNSGIGIMVPHAHASEWHSGDQSFLSAPPPHVVIRDCLDFDPDPLVFSSLSNQPLSALVTSQTVVPTGFNTGSPVSVSGQGNPQVSIAGGIWVTSGTIWPGQSLDIRLTTASNHDWDHFAEVRVGGISGTWRVRTLPALNLTVRKTLSFCTTPENFRYLEEVMNFRGVMMAGDQDGYTRDDTGSLPQPYRCGSEGEAFFVLDSRVDCGYRYGISFFSCVLE